MRLRVLLVVSFFLVGLPNLIGLAFGACARVALLCARPFWDSKVPAALGDLVAGIGTLFAAEIIARALPLGLGSWLPVVAAIWFGIHFMLRGRLREFVPASFGLLCGWLAYSMFQNWDALLIARKEEVWGWVVQYML